MHRRQSAGWVFMDESGTISATMTGGVSTLPYGRYTSTLTASLAP
jgi:hypothetical protein